jgi:hypothetical protein
MSAPAGEISYHRTAGAVVGAGQVVVITVAEARP